MTIFAHTRKALELHAAEESERLALWAAAKDPATVLRAGRAELAALREVQAAFHQDTAHVNTLEECLLISINDLRRMVDGEGWRGPARRKTDAPLRASYAPPPATPR